MQDTSLSVNVLRAPYKFEIWDRITIIVLKAEEGDNKNFSISWWCLKKMNVNVTNTSFYCVNIFRVFVDVPAQNVSFSVNIWSLDAWEFKVLLPRDL